MLITFCALVLFVVVSTAAAATRRRRWRRTARDPLARVLGRRDFGVMDSHLETVAREERRRMEREVADYLAGSAGHVLLVSTAPSGAALELSDGRRLALRGLSPYALAALHHRALRDMLRPERVDRFASSYRLRLSGAAGAGFEIYARNIALTV